jgi:hypothetical protein
LKGKNSWLIVGFCWLTEVTDELRFGDQRKNAQFNNLEVELLARRLSQRNVEINYDRDSCSK